MNTMNKINTSDAFKVKVEFWLSGDNFCFAKATEIVGTEPSHTRTKADFKFPEYAATVWEISTEYEESLDIMDQVLKIQRQLEKKPGEIRAYCEENDICAGFCIVILSNGNYLPCTSLSAQFVSLAAQLNARIDFDIYPNHFSFSD